MRKTCPSCSTENEISKRKCTVCGLRFKVDNPWHKPMSRAAIEKIPREVDTIKADLLVKIKHYYGVA